MGLEHYALAEQAHEMALFAHGAAVFVLIPGGVVTLGYDPAEEIVITPAQQVEWATIAVEAQLPPLKTYISTCLAPQRTCILPPFLLEQATENVSRVEVPPEDCLSTEFLAAFSAAVPKSPEERMQLLYKYKPKQSCEIDFNAASGVRTFINPKRPYMEFLAPLYAEGWRLPTVDEWEWAARGGSTTLFRWGIDCPDALPIKDPGLGAWDLHRQPNAFGLYCSGNPYDWEVTATGGVMVGGDGGRALCHDMGVFAAWLSLAPAFRWEYAWAADKPIFGHVRRALSLKEL